MSDVEPQPTPGTPAALEKQGGLKDDKATPTPGSDYAGKSEVEEEDAHGAEGGGMIGEG